MDEARLLADGLGDGAQEGCHVMVGLLQDFRHALQVDARHLDPGYGIAGNDAHLRPGFTDGYLDLEPALELALVQPDPLHFGPGIAFYHWPPPCSPCRYSS